MKHEQDRVSPDECVLRRIPEEWFELSKRRCAFEPHRRDADGISVFRSIFVEPFELAQASKRPASTYYVAEFGVADLIELELTVLAAADPQQLRGHAVIPELSYRKFEADRRKSKELQRALAQLASERIVYDGPSTVPC